VKDIEFLGDLLDTKFKIFGLRFGLDGLIGLIPILGDLSTTVVSLYIVFRAFVLGYPLVIIIRMLINVFIDLLVGVIPFLGALLDFVWKANTKNINLMKAYSLSPKSTQKRSRAFVGVFAFVLLSIIGLLVYAIYKVITLLPAVVLPS